MNEELASQKLNADKDSKQAWVDHRERLLNGLPILALVIAFISVALVISG